MVKPPAEQDCDETIRTWVDDEEWERLLPLEVKTGNEDALEVNADNATKAQQVILREVLLDVDTSSRFIIIVGRQPSTTIYRVSLSRSMVQAPNNGRGK